MKTCLLILALIGLQLTARAIENVALSNCVSVVKVSPMKITGKIGVCKMTSIPTTISKVGTNRCQSVLELTCYDKTNTVVATLTQSLALAKPGIYEIDFIGGLRQDDIPHIDHSALKVKKVFPLTTEGRSLEPTKQK